MAIKTPIYLDYNATTPVDREAIEAMMPYFLENYGNPSSAHSHGWKAEEAVDDAREKVAQLVNANSNEIVFTSGATESINLAIQGVINSSSLPEKHIITVTTEHKAVLDVCRHFETEDVEATYLKVDQKGLIDLTELQTSIRENTVLISVMYANNETGVIQSIREIGVIARANNVLLFSDATQSVGKTPVDVGQDNIDLMAFSAHKLYGPKGVGALYVKRTNLKIELQPLLFGGGHEKGLRSGTLNVPGIVGFGKACEISLICLKSEQLRISILRDEMESKLLEIEGVQINCKDVRRLPNTTSASFQDIEANILIESLAKEISISTGSACTTNNPEPSHVLKAMGLSSERVHGSIRISLGKTTTDNELNYLFQRIKELMTVLV
ncbi:MAG: IscS subfamily cysteine desulfurase [Bacteroidetes bacterium]|nr:cysteine desulfurase [Bacteroidia bacterium]PCH68989.1 MAG: IscS subfamily cysteine desulfurase [Bacteroidota bacterium]